MDKSRQPDPENLCAACCEVLDYTSRYVRLEGSDVCQQCLIRLFQHALAADGSFPPRWGTLLLDYHFFIDLLPARILDECRMQSIPIQNRVFCRRSVPGDELVECGGFIGERTQRPSERGFCPLCRRYTCLCCERRFYVPDPRDPSIWIRHTCTPTDTRDFDNHQLRENFAGLRRGVHFQFCPNRACGLPIELAEACNHIHCLCGADFCFVCGRFAARDSDHWRRGGCPRYGQPGAFTGVYDDDVLGDNHTDADVVTTDDSDSEFWNWERQVFEIQLAWALTGDRDGGRRREGGRQIGWRGYGDPSEPRWVRVRVRSRSLPHAPRAGPPWRRRGRQVVRGRPWYREILARAMACRRARTYPADREPRRHVRMTSDSPNGPDTNESLSSESDTSLQNSHRLADRLQTNSYELNRERAENWGLRRRSAMESRFHSCSMM